ncbi:MAG: flagellar assembly protein FliW [Nitrospirota bacterium]
MRIASTRFGPLDIHDEKVLTFPSGILGFSDWTKYVLLDHDTDVAFKWLQCAEEGSLAFVIMDPALFKPDYQVEIPDEALAEVKGRDADDLALMTILTIPSEDPARITANLRGPILMNWRTKLCKQLVLDERYPTRYPLFSGDQLQPSRSAQPQAACQS